MQHCFLNCYKANDLQVWTYSTLNNGGLDVVYVYVVTLYSVFFQTGLPGHPAEPKDGLEGPQGPRGFPGPVGQPGMAGDAGIPGVCEARDCSIHAPVMRKEMGLVKGPLSQAW